MNTIKVSLSDPKTAIQIGRRGENEVSEVIFDYSAWVAEFGPGVVSLLVLRSKDNSAYPVAMTSGAGNTVIWAITSTDTQYVGGGRAELIYTVDEQITKSVVYKTNVLPDIGEPSETPPDPYESWLETLTALGADVEGYALDAADSAELAENSVEHYPYIESDGYWYVWDASTEQFVNTDVKAEGTNGTDGTDGYSPTVTVEEISGGHRVTITDAEGDHTFDVMDGQGGSGTSDYDKLDNRPQINSHTLSGDQSAADLGLGTYSKPSGGIPKADLASDVQTSLGKADSALQYAPVTSVNSKIGAVTLSASDVGLGNVDNVQQYSATNPPPYPVTSVNSQTGAVSLSIPSSASDVGAVAVAQGVGHSGEFLVVGPDGNITTVTMTAWQGGSY